MVITVIADIIGSRKLGDRAAAQGVLDECIARVESDHPAALEPLRPTVGDEQQAVYPTLEAALSSLLLLQLALPDGVECRFGVGIGEIDAIPSARGEIPEGPGWWAAREAIEIVHAKQQRAVPSTRTWIVRGQGQDDAMRTVVDFANAYLLVRDQLVGAMTERDRRLTYGRFLRMTQRELADAERISQSAVSQALTAAGSATLVATLDLLGARA